MTRKLPPLLAIVALVLLAAQALPLQRPALPVSGELQTPPRVQAILRTACDDCHSSHTRWPWYASVAPVSWLLHDDVFQGRRRLDFSNWESTAADPGTAIQKLRNVQRVLRDHSMPPWPYRLVHPDARLSRAQREILLEWTRHAIASIPDPERR